MNKYVVHDICRRCSHSERGYCRKHDSTNIMFGQKKLIKECCDLRKKLVGM